MCELLLKVTNTTNLPFAPLAGRYNFPGHSMTLIVKGTYSIAPGKPPVALPKQPFPTGDQYYPDDEDQTGPPRYESDFAFYKPRADLLLVGACHPPGGVPVPICQALFRVGTKSGALSVIGERRWEKKFLSRAATAPQPFRRMELRYESSYGGAGFVTNPIGKGHAPLKGGSGQEIWPLPNIENPAQLIQNPKDRPFPAGFAPLSPKWDTRKSKLGTYTGSYRKTRWPWFPADFDYAYFNAAPPEMQANGFLLGDEPLYFENLHPDFSVFESNLPGIRVRCFINRAGATSPGRFEEVTMNLDTLWVDMEAQSMVLLWRGVAAVASEEFEDVADVFIMDEPLAGQPASLEACRRKFLELQNPPEEPPEEPPPPAPSEPVMDDAAREKLKAESRRRMQVQLDAVYKQMGIDTSGFSPELKARQAAILDQMTENDPAAATARHEADMQNQLRTALSKIGLDFDNLPALSAKAHAEQIRFWESQGIKPGEIAGNSAFSRLTLAMGALLPKMGHDPENLSPLIDQMKQARAKAGVPEPDTQPRAEPDIVWTRRLVEQTAAEGKSLAGRNLVGLDLSGLNLQSADFAGANLSKCNLIAANISGCNFARANLAGADLSRAAGQKTDFSRATLAGAKLHEADISEAEMAGANLSGADLTAARLDAAVLENATLTDAVLGKASARGAVFVAADLSRCKLQAGIFTQADFTSATLNHADFSSAVLQQASVEKTVGADVNFAGADAAGLRADNAVFTRANFHKLNAPGSIWPAAALTGADFRHAKLPQATFTSANAAGADFSAADLKESRLNKANLTGAKLVKANCFRASFEKANLTLADLSGANAYGAEFLNAVLDKTITDAATNVKMSKLAESD